MPRIHLGPLESFVNVGWGGGIYILITVEGTYDQGAPGSRDVTVALTKVGEDVGARVMGFRKFEIAASGGNKPMIRVKAVLRMSRMPAVLDASYRITLKGSEIFPDPSRPPPMVQPFCGTTTSSNTTTIVYRRIPGVEQFPPAYHYWAVSDWTTSSPAGTGTLHLEYEAAGGQELKEGTWSSTSTAHSIWYQDAAGNWHDTGEPCELGDPPPPPIEGGLKVEGFDFIEAKIFPQKGYKVTNPASWEADSDDEDIIAPIPNVENYGGWSWLCRVPKRDTGRKDETGSPVLEDLKSGDYEFRVHQLEFTHQPPATLAKRHKTFVTYTQAPPSALYQFKLATTKPRVEYHPPFVGDDEQRFPPGIPPPPDQILEA